jgi:uncharacterized protein YdeI (YjbR/CyaY-like superfamily)
VAVDVPQIAFQSDADWERWLEANHATAAGVWIRMARKGSGIASVSLPEALDTALCFGWIDGIRKSLDDQCFLQRYQPRQTRSRWSKINVGHAERLIAEGRMRPPGVAEIERAKADGRWAAAYASPSNMTVPDDLQRELDARPAAKAFFATLSSQNRYAILYRLQDAKRPETRARRLAQFVAMLEAGETLH